jgi:hypothetical protein
MFVYAIECENCHFYVGKTANIKERWKAHCTGKGCWWTELHKPVRLLFCKRMQHPMDETLETLKLMSAHGSEMVRGGAFSMQVIPRNIKTALTQMIEYTKDLCLYCAQSGHLQKNCPVAKKRIQEYFE